MKKALLILLAALTVLTLVSCGGGKAGSTTAGVQSTEPEATEEVTTAAATKYGNSDEESAEAVLGKMGLDPMDVLTSLATGITNEYESNSERGPTFYCYVVVEEFTYDTFLQFLHEVADATRNASFDGKIYSDPETTTAIVNYDFPGLEADTLTQNLLFYYNTDTFTVRVNIKSNQYEVNKIYIQLGRSYD